MDWTPILVAVVGLIGTITTILLKNGITHNSKHKQLDDDIKALKDVVKELCKSNLKLRLNFMFKFDRHNSRGINEAMDDYKALNGNGSIKFDYDIWQKWYKEDIAEAKSKTQ